MASMFRRRVEIVSTAQDATREVRASLEDDFHHFRVWLRHCDGIVSEIGGEAVRYPYSACPQAAEQLQQLIGMPLSQIAHSVTRQTDAQHQCTHLLDLAGLAIANAARGTTQRRYDIQVPTASTSAPTRSCSATARLCSVGTCMARPSRAAALLRGQSARRNGSLGAQPSVRRGS